jgi:hypothetical protein
MNKKGAKERKGRKVCFVIFAAEFLLAFFALRWLVRKSRRLMGEIFRQRDSIHTSKTITETDCW